MILASPAGAAEVPVTPHIPEPEALATQKVVGAWENVLYAEPPVAPRVQAASLSLHGGSIDGDIGLTPGAGCPTDGTVFLVQSSFGQPFAATVPYVYDDAGRQLSFADANLLAARKKLYWDKADSQTWGTNAAFRYKVLLYDVDPGDGLSIVNRIEARLDGSIATYYTATDRARTVDAERLLRDALKYDPLNPRLRKALLDLYYDRAVAEVAFAKEELVEAARKQLDPPPPGGFVLDSEIAAYEDALGTNENPGGYRFALAGYFELLKDPMGVDVSQLPGSSPTEPYGYYLFRTDAPTRNQYAALFLDDRDCTPSCNYRSVLDQAIVPDPDNRVDTPTFSGFKDLVLIFTTLQEYGDVAAQLAKRYHMRGNAGSPSDDQLALALIAETQRKLYLQGSLLLGMFDPEDLPPAGNAAGLAEAIAGWRHSLVELTATRDFIRGEANSLGFSPDFLMLVQKFQGQSGDLFDSYDALSQWIVQNATAPLNWAVQKYTEANASYANYRGHVDQLATQYADRNTAYDDRLFRIVGANRGDAGYDHPETNVGSEIWQQLRSIEVAQGRLQKAALELENLGRQIEIEVDRRGQERGIYGAISQVYIEYGSKQAALTREIAKWRAAAAAANAMVGDNLLKPSTWGGGHALNAAFQAGAALEEGRLQAKKEELAAKERAEVNDLQNNVLDVNSKSNIKTWALRADSLEIDIAETTILLKQEQARLTALRNEKADIEQKMDQANVGLLNRYFSDPNHRIKMQADTLEAEMTFREAQKWVYYTARALEYKWNMPFVHTHAGKNWSVGSVFKLRNAAELQAMVAAMQDFNGLLDGTMVKDDYYDWFSFREDFLGLKRYDAQGRVLYYTDPVTGVRADALTTFRNFLTRNKDTNGNINLEFSTAREVPGGTFFLGPRYNPNGSLASKGLWLDKIKWMQFRLPGSHTTGRAQIAGQVTYGGSCFLRTQNVGTVPDANRPDRVVGELTAWSTRYWYYDGGSNSWRFSEGLSAPVQMQMTSDPRIPPTVTQVDVFKERSVAATGWKLSVPTRDLGVEILKISELNDIEVYFYHYAVVRP